MNAQTPLLPAQATSDPAPSRPRHHRRQSTFPHAHATRHKPRRLPLVFRFIKGAVHAKVVVPVLFHSLFTTLIVFLDHYVNNLGLPSSVVPSLSIVVGLMLVFRNQTSYDRFWTGRNTFGEAGASVRTLVRNILVQVRDGRIIGGRVVHLTEEETAETEQVIRILIATLYATKFNLRQEWTVGRYKEERRTRCLFSRMALPVATSEEEQAHTIETRYAGLLPKEFLTLEHLGWALPLQLMVHVEAYVSHFAAQGYWDAPVAAYMSNQIGTYTALFSKMETIRTTPLPIAYLIHQKQVLALYLAFLPFTIVDTYQWFSILLVSLVAFTLYGIEGIGCQLEDPFGYDRNDIKMDGIVEDWRAECMCMLDEWKMGDEGVFGSCLPKAIGGLGKWE